jgi:DNA-binding IclR family transcriptional regulator
MPADDAPRTREPVTRAMQMLAAMVDAGGRDCGVRELAERLEIPSSSAHRLLRLLQQASMVTRSDEGTYSLALEFYRLAWRATSGHGLREAAVPAIGALVEEIDETAFLGVYDEGRREMMFVLGVESGQDVRYVAEVNVWLPMTDGSSGYAITAFLPDEDVEAIIAREWPKASAKELAALRGELASTRERGYALYLRQRDPAAVGMAAPIWDASGRVVADVFVAMPAARFQTRRERALATAIQGAAGHITRAIGGRVAAPGAE